MVVFYMFIVTCVAYSSTRLGTIWVTEEELPLDRPRQGGTMHGSILGGMSQLAHRLLTAYKPATSRSTARACGRPQRAVVMGCGFERVVSRFERVLMSCWLGNANQCGMASNSSTSPPIYDSGLLAQRIIVIARIIHQDPDERVGVSRSAGCRVSSCAMK